MVPAVLYFAKYLMEHLSIFELRFTVLKLLITVLLNRVDSCSNYNLYVEI